MKEGEESHKDHGSQTLQRQSGHALGLQHVRERLRNGRSGGTETYIVVSYFDRAPSPSHNS